VQRFGRRSREGKVFIKDKAKVASRVGRSESIVVYFRKLLFKSDNKKLSFRRVESQKVCSHPGRDLLLSILQVSDIRLEFRWMERKEELCVVSIQVVI